MTEQVDKSEAEDFLDAVLAEKSGGEDRPQQREMVKAVYHALTNQEHLLVQAGTGVGKTLGYLIPTLASKKTAIISTATNQLSQQIYDKDLPVAKEAYEKQFGETMTYAIVKGRANYLCLAKLNDLKKLDEGTNSPNTVDLFEDIGEESPLVASLESSKSAADEYKSIYDWAGKTTTGDRADAPTVSDKVWKGVSTTSAECPGRGTCPFAEDCFAELARDKGAASDIVVTNHALVGADLDGEGRKILGEKEVIIADEAHELEKYLTSAWGTEFTVKRVKDAVTAGRKAVDAAQHSDRAKLDELEEISEALEKFLEEETPQRYSGGIQDPLRGVLERAQSSLAYLAARFGAKSEGAEGSERIRLRMASGISEDLVNSIHMLLQDDGEMVQWLGHVRVKKDLQIPTLYAAPIRIGPKLMGLLDQQDLTFVATSATITVGGNFDIPMRNLALDEPLGDPDTMRVKPARPAQAVDVGTPFKYQKQGILYIPTPNDIAIPVGKDRFEHSSDVKDFVVEAVSASRGRALILSTKTDEARSIGEYLRKHVDTPVLIQGDMPAGRIVEAFKEDVPSTLVGTMGFWHGLDAPGETCSLVIIDKIPFSPMDDPLMSARQEDAQERGGSGFMEVYVAAANIMLAQGMGRLIRHTTDRGVVAILDPRLQTKPYGRAMQQSLPQMYRTANREQVLKSLGNL